MKKLLFLFLLMNVFMVKAQLSSVTQISSYSNAAITTLAVSDTLRGGEFSLYKGADPVDNGMIFKDKNNNKWLRQVTGSTISTAWYGMRSYVVAKSNSENDCYDAFMAAVNYIYTHKQFNTLYIPYDPSGVGTYQFYKTVTLDKDINITGDGITGKPLTKIGLAKDRVGIFLASTNSAHIKLENLDLYQMTSSDSSAHGLDIRTFFHLKNVSVNNCSGNGINIRACAGVGNPYFGNVDQSLLENVQVFECLNGMYISGCDANVIDVNNCSFVYNKRWGVYDDGFLGNLYRNCHFASNSQHGGVVVTYNGHWYVPVDDSVTLGKRPDLYPNYWYEIAGMGGATPWSASTKYYSGGVAIIKNINAYTNFDHCYTESNQPPIILNGRSLYNGGTAGSEVKNGIFTKASFGSYLISGGGTAVETLGIGAFPTSGKDWSLDMVAKNHNAIRVTSPDTYTIIKLQNSIDANCQIGYSGKILVFNVYPGSIMQLDSAGLSGYADGTFNLGKPAQRWGHIYGNYFHGDGSGLTNISATASFGSIKGSYSDNASLANAFAAKQNINYAEDAGATDNYTISLSPTPTAYTTGMQVIFKAGTANADGCTININSLGAKKIVKRVNTTLATGDILAGMMCLLIYDGANFVIMNPVAN